MSRKIQLRLFFMMFLAVVFSCVISTSAFAATKETNDITKKISSKKTVSISADETYKKLKGFVYLKYKSTLNGYVKLTFNEAKSGVESKGHLWITSKSKYNLSNHEFYSTSKAYTNSYKNVYYGVKKGQTYYFKIQADNAVKISLKEYKINDKSGHSMKKALNLKAKKTLKGYMAAGNTEDDYYKITLKDKQKINITLKGYTNNALNMTMYMVTDTHIFRQGQFTLRYTSPNHTVNYKSKKLKAGTYYLVISNGSKSSGAYSISWKKVS